MGDVRVRRGGEREWERRGWVEGERGRRLLLLLLLLLLVEMGFSGLDVVG